MTTLHEHVAALFDGAQRSGRVHKTTVETLLKTIEDWRQQSNDENAQEKKPLEVLSEMLTRILVVESNEGCADNAQKFVVKVIAAMQRNPELDEMWTGLVRVCLEFAFVENKRARVRSVDTIGAVFEDAVEHAELDHDLWKALRKALVTCMRDKVPRVRQSAALALRSLQDPSRGERDPVYAEYARAIDADSSKDVRAAIVRSIELHGPAIGLVLERIRDIKPEVRKAAIQRLVAEPRLFQVLSIAQRVHVLSEGLRDRNSGVKQLTTRQLLCETWLNASPCDGRPLELMRLLDAEHNEEVALLVCERLLAYASGDFCDVLQPFRSGEQELSDVAVVLYWRAACEFLHKSEAFDRLEDQCLPDVVQFSELLQTHMHDECIFRQLLHIGRYIDYQQNADDAGRLAVKEALSSMLSSPSTLYSMYPLLFKVLARVLDQSALRLEVVTLVDDHYESMVDLGLQKGRRAMEQIQLEHDIELARGSGDDDEEEEDNDDEKKRTLMQMRWQHEMEENLWLQSLTLIDCFVRECPRGAKGCRKLSDVYLAQIVFESLTHESATVKELGFGCLGTVSLLDRAIANSCVQEFQDVILGAAAATEGIRNACVQAIADICLVFADEPLFRWMAEQLVLNVVHRWSPLVQSTAVCGAAKVLLHQPHISCDQVLIRLLQLTFSSEDALCQKLTLFWMCYCSSMDNRGKIKDVVLETALSLLNVSAEDDPDLADVNALQAIKQIVMLVCGGAETAPLDLRCALASELLRGISTQMQEGLPKNARKLASGLLAVPFSPEDHGTEEIHHLFASSVAPLAATLTDGVARRSLRSFADRLDQELPALQPQHYVAPGGSDSEAGTSSPVVGVRRSSRRRNKIIR